MKKSIKLISALLICLLICVCGFSVFGGINTGTIYKSGYGNNLKTVRYDLIVRENGENSLRLYREEVLSDEDVSKRTVDDFEKSGDYSSAEWQLYGDNEPFKRTEIKLLTVENGISVIGKNAFRGQSKLETVTLPYGLTEIKDGAFDGCTSIKKVIFGGTKQEWDNLTIGSDNEILKTAEIEFASAKPGDVNGDGKINVSDCTAICLYKAGKINLTDAQLAVADVTNDGNVDKDDADKIAEYIAKIIPQL